MSMEGILVVLLAGMVVFLIGVVIGMMAVRRMSYL
jgi:hypothetical protein